MKSGNTSESTYVMQEPLLIGMVQASLILLNASQIMDDVIEQAFLQSFHS